MKKIFTLAIIVISFNCLSQTLNDTIPYLKKTIVNQFSDYKDKPLSTLLDNIPYKINGYDIKSKSNLKEDLFANAKLGGVTLFFSPKKEDDILSILSGSGENYSAKTITIYLKNNDTSFFDDIFLDSLDANNWNNSVEQELRKPKYIVESVRLSNN